MNRKGLGKLNYLYLFVIWIIVAGGVFGMVYVFYGIPLDVRTIEVEILENKVADCISYGGRVNEKIFNENGFSEQFKNNFLKNCHLNFNSEIEGQQYYIEIDFHNLSDEKVFEIFAGDENLKSRCEVMQYENAVKCVKKRFYSLHNKEQYLIEILSVVKKIEKNEK